MAPCSGFAVIPENASLPPHCNARQSEASGCGDRCVLAARGTPAKMEERSAASSDWAASREIQEMGREEGSKPMEASVERSEDCVAKSLEK